MEEIVNYEAVFRNSMDALLITSPDGGIFAANNAACNLFQMTEEEIINSGRTGLVDSSDKRLTALLDERRAKGRAQGELFMIRKDGSRFLADISSVVFKIPGGALRTVMIIRDITTKKLNEDLRLCYIEILRIINGTDTLADLASSVSSFIKTYFRFDAMALRLRNGIDFPYFVTLGLAQEFVRLENTLLSYDKEGKILTDDAGKPILECICGMVITGNYDPGNPLFTANGSFWTNDISGLIASYDLSELVPRSRLRCLGEGYESAALLPLKSEGEILGLLQILDREKNRFYPELISFLENITDLIATAIRKKLSSDQIRESAKLLSSVIEKYDSAFWIIDSGMKLIAGNSVFHNRLLKYLGSRLNEGQEITLCHKGKNGRKWIEYYRRGLDGTQFSATENAVPGIKTRIMQYSFYPVFGNDGSVKSLSILESDVTGLINLKKKYQKSTRELRALAKHIDEIVERERERISRDLHDDLSQKLTAISLELASVKSGTGVKSHRIEEKFEKIFKLIAETHAAVRKILYGLRPGLLNDLELAESIEWQLNDFGKSTGIHTIFICPDRDLKPDNELSSDMLRIIREALTNIVRHSGANNVTVELKHTPSKISLFITDNGKGISAASVNSSRSLGLVGMRERAIRHNGSFYISGSAGKGTTIKVTFPGKFSG